MVRRGEREQERKREWAVAARGRRKIFPTRPQRRSRVQTDEGIEEAGMCPGEALISPYINLPVAHNTDSAPCLFWYPWRTYFRCATPKCAQAGPTRDQLSRGAGPKYLRHG